MYLIKNVIFINVINNHKGVNDDFKIQKVDLHKSYNNLTYVTIKHDF